MISSDFPRCATIHRTLHTGDSLVHCPQFRGDNSQDTHREERILLGYHEKSALVERDKFTVGQGYDVTTGGLLIYHRELAKEFTFLQSGNGFTADTHLQFTGEDDEHPVVRFTLPHENLPGAKGLASRFVFENGGKVHRNIETI
jgi:hypothetical protein